MTTGTSSLRRWLAHMPIPRERQHQQDQRRDDGEDDRGHSVAEPVGHDAGEEAAEWLYAYACESCLVGSSCVNQPWTGS